MTDVSATVADVASPSPASCKWLVYGGRALLTLALIAGWEYGARSLGPLFFAPPLETAQRLWALALSGQMFSDIMATLRVAVAGFAIAGIAGVILPFLLRRSPRATEAIEPAVMFTMGIPKYALAPWLILWFGIGDMPKLVVVVLVVFYIVFITTFAGIRGVDRRLVSMARVIGASERRISREIIWTSLLPFFFTGLKIAFPRAVSATIVGEFLVATQGVGRYIEGARQVSDTTGVFAGVVIALALVLVINAVLNAIERRALRWRPVEREMEL